MIINLNIFEFLQFRHSCTYAVPLPSTYSRNVLLMFPNDFLLQIMTGHRQPVLCLMVKDKLLYSGSQDCTIRCWVRNYGHCSRIFKGHKDSVVSFKIDNGICK